MADLDNQAMFCPYCAQRVASIKSGKNKVPALILAGLMVFILYMVWVFAYHPWQERQRVRILMQSAYQHCFPETAEDPTTQALIEKTKEVIDALDLDGIDRSQMDAEFESGINARGCGPGARNAL